MAMFRGKAIAYGETTDGREVVVQIRMDNHPIITIGPKRSPVHHEQWLYKTPEQAVRAFMNWNPATEPEPADHVQTAKFTDRRSK